MNKTSENTTDKWQRLHQSLQDLLAGYADDELDDGQVLIVEAHLAGCETCRHDLARQKILHKRLSETSAPRMPASLQDKVNEFTSRKHKLSDYTVEQLGCKLRSLFKRCKNSFNFTFVMAASGWAMTIILAVMIIQPNLNQFQNKDIPMIDDALTEYNKIKNSSFPSSNMTTVAEAPIKWPNSHVIASWTIKVAGTVTPVFAIRSGKDIILQYQINENIFFRNPIVRKALAESGYYKQRKDNIDILAVPLSHSGVLVIGPAESLPRLENIEI